MMPDTVEQQLEQWRQIALWLADCHAATAEYDCGLKSVSKTRKDRLRSICTKAATLCETGDYFFYFSRSQTTEWVLEALRKAATHE